MLRRIGDRIIARRRSRTYPAPGLGTGQILNERRTFGEPQVPVDCLNGVTMIVTRILALLIHLVNSSLSRFLLIFIFPRNAINIKNKYVLYFVNFSSDSCTCYIWSLVAQRLTCTFYLYYLS